MGPENSAGMEAVASKPIKTPEKPPMPLPDRREYYDRRDAQVRQEKVDQEKRAGIINQIKNIVRPKSNIEQALQIPPKADSKPASIQDVSKKSDADILIAKNGHLGFREAYMNVIASWVPRGMQNPDEKQFADHPDGKIKSALRLLTTIVDPRAWIRDRRMGDALDFQNKVIDKARGEKPTPIKSQTEVKGVGKAA